MNQGGNTPTYCTVTFDIENGQYASEAITTFENPSDATRQVEAGQQVGTLPTPNRANGHYTFSGWRTATSSSAGQQVTDQTVITNDITFYAIFIPAGLDN